MCLGAFGQPDVVVGSLIAITDENMNAIETIRCSGFPLIPIIVFSAIIEPSANREEIFNISLNLVRGAQAGTVYFCLVVCSENNSIGQRLNIGNQNLRQNAAFVIQCPVLGKVFIDPIRLSVTH